MKKYLLTVLATMLFYGIASAQDSQSNVIIRPDIGARVIPISLSGYNGQVASVLRFDLEVAGFEITTPEKAQYSLSGKNDGGQVEGRLQDLLSKANLLAKAYTGDNERIRAHALADDEGQRLAQPGV